MNAESLALLIDEATQFERKLGGFPAGIYGNIDKSTYETIEEQVKEIRKVLWEFKDLLINLEIKIQ